MEVQIEVIRPGKTPRVFQEGLVSDDGLCLKTSTVVPADVVGPLSGAFARAGLLAPGVLIRRVDKFNFYRQPFAIMRVHDGEGVLLGYYCDVTTPLERAPLGYLRTDLFLDLWLGAAGERIVLDEDELEDALGAAVITAEQGEYARQSLARMLAEEEAGIFPLGYIA